MRKSKRKSKKRLKIKDEADARVGQAPVAGDVHAIVDDGAVLIFDGLKRTIDVVRGVGMDDLGHVETRQNTSSCLLCGT